MTLRPRHSAEDPVILGPHGLRRQAVEPADDDDDSGIGDKAPKDFVDVEDPTVATAPPSARL
jgi:hypothetical protein